MAKYKKRKDGRYLAQVPIGFQDNGKPKYKNLYGRTVAELDKKVVEFKANLYKGILVDDGNLTLGAWADYWVETYKSNMSYSVLNSNSGVVKNHLGPIRNIKLGKIKTCHLQEFINAKSKECNVSLIAIVLKSLLKQAVTNELIHKNPMDGVVVPKCESNKRRPLTTEERRAILNADLTAFERAFVYVCLYAGLRRGEALALMRGDIDFEDNVIKVRRTLTATKSGNVVKDGTKTKAGVRDVPLIEPLRSVLVEHLEDIDGLYLFTNRRGGVIANSSFSSIWNVIMDKLNKAVGGSDTLKIIHGITPHYLRHTYATDLYYAGVDIKTCQYLLGHSTIQMTMDIYTHLEKRNDNTLQMLQAYTAATQSVVSQSDDSSQKKESKNA